ncbi:hypothetical protein SAMN05216276_11313 [Streptosporangium subroseum]|uniref:Uncharacterized protein n=1 Tax=Streptosporangium subroseum TaxID=106412 RepID=A0A239PCA7_9ACTN|nr:hypothetical protein SAMN05216276_11313 [Streptosporangium subroseum]
MTASALAAFTTYLDRCALAANMVAAYRRQAFAYRELSCSTVPATVASGLRGGCNLDATCQNALNVVTVPAGTASAARGADP